MTRLDFRNLLCILQSIDPGEISGATPRMVDMFQVDPVKAFLRADDVNATAIWAAIEARCAPVQVAA